MNLEYLKTFLEVKRIGSFSEVAKRLGMSQPAVSFQIGKLERELGVRLFERSLTSCSSARICGLLRISTGTSAFFTPAMHRRSWTGILSPYTVPPGCWLRSRSRADTIRTCISVKLSPPGNRNVDGARCTVDHSGSFTSFLSSAPVHSPKSHSSRPLSVRVRSPSAFEIGAAASGRFSRRRRTDGSAPPGYPPLPEPW